MAKRRSLTAGRTRYLAVRMFHGVIVVVGAILVSFALANLTGSPTVGTGGGLLTQEQIFERDEKLGYHDPLIERFATFMSGGLRGDFGESVNLGESAMGLVLRALPYTLLLVAGAVFFALMLAVPAAVYGAMHPESRGDRLARIILFVGLGLPEFWLGLVLLLVFSVKLGVTHGVGYHGLGSAILPMIALAVPLAPSLARLLRGEMLDVLQRDFVLVLRAKGLSSRFIVTRHVTLNAMPTFVTFLALQIGYLLGGTLVVEQVFTWPGIGTAMLNAVNGRDVNVVQAGVVVLATSYVAINLVADVVVQFLDPRVRRAT